MFIIYNSHSGVSIQSKTASTTTATLWSFMRYIYDGIDVTLPLDVYISEVEYISSHISELRSLGLIDSDEFSKLASIMQQLRIAFNNWITGEERYKMYKFTSYKLMLDILAVHGLEAPATVNNSTLWRWRNNDSVPVEQWLLLYYYTCRAVKDFNDTDDLLGALKALGYETGELL